MLNFCNTKSRRVVRSALVAKTFRMADACDDSIIIQQELTEILKKNLEIKILTDSEQIFNVVIRNAPSQNKD